MKRIVAGTICFILAVLMALSAIVGLFGQAATTPSVNISLQSTATQVIQGNTFKVNVNMDLSGFGTSDVDGVFSFSDLKVSFNQSLFEVVYTTVPDAPAAYTATQSGNTILISFNKTKNAKYEPILEKTKTICSISFRVKSTAMLVSSEIGLTATKFYDYTIASNSSNAEIKSTYSSPLSIEITNSLSNNTFLKSLSVQEGNLKPAFNKNTTSYTVAVDNDVTRLNVVAEAEDATSKINVIGGNGNTNLKIGDNTIQVIVTAQDGSSKIYKITAKRASGDASTISESSSESSASSGVLTPEAYAKKLQVEQNRSLLINLFLVFIILSELAYIIILKYGDKLFKKKQK